MEVREAFQVVLLASWSGCCWGEGDSDGVLSVPLLASSLVGVCLDSPSIGKAVGFSGSWLWSVLDIVGAGWMLWGW